MSTLLRRSLLPLGGLVLLFAACIQPGPRDSTPALPDGFGAVLPDAPLAGYVYLNQPSEEAPLILDTELLTESGVSIPLTGNLHALALWLSPVDGQPNPTVVLRLTFFNEEEAFAAEQRLTNAASSDDVWLQREETDISIILGQGFYAAAYRDALSAKRFTDLETAKKNIWNTTLSLPEHPDRPPIAAGYLAFPPNYLPVALDLLATRSGLDLRPFGSLLSQSGVGSVAFAAYGDSFPVVSVNMSVEDFAAHRIAAFAVTDTTVPAPLLSWSFNLGAQRLGLRPINTSDGRAYLHRDDDLITIARTHETSILATFAFSEIEAKNLLLLR